MLSKNWTKTKDGIAANISPYSWTEPNHGLRLNVTLISTGQTCFPNTKKPFSDCTEDDAMTLLSCIKIESCQCGRPRFAQPLAQNRGDLCEVCFMNKIRTLHDSEPATSNLGNVA